ncbi:zinc finger protein 407 [Aplochiton taeniatus]
MDDITIDTDPATEGPVTESTEDKESGGPTKMEDGAVSQATHDGCTCPICNFVAKTPTALKIHSARKHPRRAASQASPDKANRKSKVLNNPEEENGCADPGDTTKIIKIVVERQNQLIKSEASGKDMPSPSSDVITEDHGSHPEGSTREESTAAKDQGAPGPESPNQRRVSKRTPKPKIIYSCSYCGLEFRDKPPLEVHIRTHTKEMEHFCEACSFACVLKCDYEKHCGSNKHKKVVVGETEPPRSVSVSVQEHMAEEASPQAPSDVPTASSPPPTRPAKRQPQLSSRFQLQCGICEFRVSTPALLESHARVKHPGEDWLHCTLCHYYSATEGWMKQHVCSDGHQQRLTAAKAPASEELVEKVSRDTAGAGALTDDVTPWPGGEGDGAHVEADVAAEEAVEAAKAVLAEVEENMDDSKPTKRKRGRPKMPATTTCSHCGLVVSNATNLSVHIRRKHSKEYSFNCRLCKYSCVTKGDMERHCITKKHVKRLQEADATVPVLSGGSASQGSDGEPSQDDIVSSAEGNADPTQDLNPLKKSKYDSVNSCSHCDFVAHSIPSLILHVKRKHTRDFEFVCLACSYYAVTRREMSRHALTEKHKQKSQAYLEQGGEKGLQPQGEAVALGEMEVVDPSDPVGSPSTQEPDSSETCQATSVERTDSSSEAAQNSKGTASEDPDKMVVDTARAEEGTEVLTVKITDRLVSTLDVPEPLGGAVVDSKEDPAVSGSDAQEEASVSGCEPQEEASVSAFEPQEAPAVSGAEAQENLAVTGLDVQESPAEVEPGLVESTEDMKEEEEDEEELQEEEEEEEEEDEEEFAADTLGSDEDMEVDDDKEDSSYSDTQLARAVPFDACIVSIKSLAESEVALLAEGEAAVSGLSEGPAIALCGPRRPRPAVTAAKVATPNARVRCDDCGFLADGLSGLNVHISMKHPSKEKHFHCLLCGKSFYTESNLHQHLTSASHMRNEQSSIEELPEGGACFKCAKCTDRFESEQELFVHIKEKHEELLREVNKYVQEDTEQINRERQENQGSVCKYCGKVCKSSNSMAFLAHVRTHTGSKPFKCKICNFATAQLGDARNHVKRHLGMREYKCHICGWAFVMKKHLSTHLLGKHGVGQPKERKFECELCDRAFSEKWALSNHMKLHTGQKPYKCAWASCHYAFLTLSAMKDHYRTHTGEKSFLCDQCGFAGATRHALTKHRRQHTGERPFKCQLCSFASTTQSHLTRHNRVHTGEKPYRCPWCEYRSNCAENIRKHILHTGKHEGVKMYNCPKGDFATNSPMDFRNHLKENHADIENPDLAYLHAGIVSKSFECRLKGQGATFVETEGLDSPLRRTGSMDASGQDGGSVQQVIIIQGYGGGEVTIDQALEESAAATLQTLAMAGQVAEVLHITEDGQVIASGREVSAGGAHLAGGTTQYVLLDSGEAGGGLQAVAQTAASENSTALDALLTAVSEMGQQEEAREEASAQGAVQTEELAEDEVKQEAEEVALQERREPSQEEVVQEVLQFAASQLMMKEGLRQVIVNSQGTHYIVTELDDHTLQVEGAMYAPEQTEEEGGGEEEGQPAEGVIQQQPGGEMVVYLDGAPHSVVLED